MHHCSTTPRHEPEPLLLRWRPAVLAALRGRPSSPAIPRLLLPCQRVFPQADRPGQFREISTATICRLRMSQPLAQVLQKCFLLLLGQQFDGLFDFSERAHARKMPDFLRGVNGRQGHNHQPAITTTHPHHIARSANHCSQGESPRALPARSGCGQKDRGGEEEAQRERGCLHASRIRG